LGKAIARDGWRVARSDDRDRRCGRQPNAGSEVNAIVGRNVLSARTKAAGIQMVMLVGEQKQDGVALLLDPAGRRSLISWFRRIAQLELGEQG
jgi:hypothetical protein